MPPAGREEIREGTEWRRCVRVRGGRQPVPMEATHRTQPQVAMGWRWKRGGIGSDRGHRQLYPQVAGCDIDRWRETGGHVERRRTTVAQQHDAAGPAAHLAGGVIAVGVVYGQTAAHPRMGRKHPAFVSRATERIHGVDARSFAAAVKGARHRQPLQVMRGHGTR
eukprot:ctg_2306.g545